MNTAHLPVTIPKEQDSHLLLVLCIIPTSDHTRLSVYQFYTSGVAVAQLETKDSFLKFE